MRSLLFLLLVASAMRGAPAQTERHAHCNPSLEPTRKRISLPDTGGIVIDEEAVPEDTAAWKTGTAGASRLYIKPVLHDGAGRYWSIALGPGPLDSDTPSAGVVFQTSTPGWRTLRNFENRALPWIEDVDGDGSDEAVIWSSFPTVAQPSQADYGLIAFVYRLAEKGGFVFDRKGSCLMQRRIVAAYEHPLTDTNMAEHQKAKRRQIAEMLKEHLDCECLGKHITPEMLKAHERMGQEDGDVRESIRRALHKRAHVDRQGRNIGHDHFSLPQQRRVMQRPLELRERHDPTRCHAIWLLAPGNRFR